MESNLVQINVIRYKSIIMQMNTSAQRMFMSLQRIFKLILITCPCLYSSIV